MREVFTLENIINIMIELEDFGRHHYIEVKAMTDDYKPKEFIGILATQETAHKKLYAKYKNMNITFERNIVNNEYEAYMDSLLKGTVRFLEQSKEINSFEHGINIAINLEKDTKLFLTELRRIIDRQYHEVIDNITD